MRIYIFILKLFIYLSKIVWVWDRYLGYLKIPSPLVLPTTKSVSAWKRGHGIHSWAPYYLPTLFTHFNCKTYEKPLIKWSWYRDRHPFNYTLKINCGNMNVIVYFLNTPNDGPKPQQNLKENPLILLMIF